MNREKTTKPESVNSRQEEAPTVMGRDALGKGVSQLLAGRYELIGLIGVGGMGSVYRARDLELDEVVALKMLRRDLIGNEGMLTRFRQEVKLARRVTHRNVARTFDIGEHAGNKFLTMEFVDGESLGALIARDRLLPVSRVVEICKEICEGLTAAHGAGVVHRDLKPDNVLIAKDGRVVLTDFGIARAFTDSGPTVVTMGGVIGTPFYMAPEQMEGSPKIDARADVYALGAMLYELFTGERASQGSSIYAIITARLLSPPPDPKVKRPELPTAAAEVVLKCMARQPEARFSSAREVRDALGAIASAGPVGLTAKGIGGPPVIHVAPAPSPVVATLAGIKTVAVLPFQNVGPIENEYLADGLTDDLIDILSMTNGLKVRSRGAVMPHKGVTRDARDIGRDLDVQVVVEGSLRKMAEKLRISARVVSVADGFQLWAKRFDCPESDFLVVGDEIASAIAEALAVERHPNPRSAPTDPVAVDLYLRGRHEYQKRGSEPMRAAIRFFEDALKRAPHDPTILAAHAISLLREFEFDPAAEHLIVAAQHSAEEALAQSPHLGEAHFALSVYRLNTGDPIGAAIQIRKTLAIAPSLADAHEQYGRMLCEVGLLDEGIAHIEAAMKLEPRLFHLKWEIARLRGTSGDAEGARESFAVEPTEPTAINTYWVTRARLAIAQRNAEEGRTVMARARSGETFPGPALAMYALLAGKGSIEMGRAQLDELARTTGRAKRRRAFFSQIKAEIFAYMGDEATALEAIAAASESMSFDVFWMDHCPLFEAIRKESRFIELRGNISDRASLVRQALRG